MGVVALVGCAVPPAPVATPGLGQPVALERAAAIDPTVFASGRGLPPGSGTARAGAAVYEARCAACHGENGAGGNSGRLVGREPLAGNPRPEKTIGQYWPHATTVFDYIRRAMPPDAPGTLTNDEVYALTAYLLAANGVIAGRDEMNAATLPRVVMPNRDGFVRAVR